LPDEAQPWDFFTMCQECTHVYKCSCTEKKLHHCRRFQKELRNRGCLSTLIYAVFPREHCGRIKYTEARHENRRCSRCRNGFQSSKHADKRTPYEMVKAGEDPLRRQKPKTAKARPVRKEDIRVVPGSLNPEPLFYHTTTTPSDPSQAALDPSPAVAIDPIKGVFGSTKTRHKSPEADAAAAPSEQLSLPAPPPKVFRLHKEQGSDIRGGTQRPRRDRIHGPPPPAMYNKSQAKAVRSASRNRRRPHGGASSSSRQSSSSTRQPSSTREPPPGRKRPVQSISGKRSPPPPPLDLRAARKPSTTTRVDRATSSSTTRSSRAGRQAVVASPPIHHKGYNDASSAMAASLASMQVETDRVARLYAMRERRAREPASAGPYYSEARHAPPRPRRREPQSARLPPSPPQSGGSDAEAAAHNGPLPAYALKRSYETFRGYAAWAEHEDRHRREEKLKEKKEAKKEAESPASVLLETLVARRGMCIGGSGPEEDGSDASSEASFACADAKRVERRRDENEAAT